MKLGALIAALEAQRERHGEDVDVIVEYDTPTWLELEGVSEDAQMNGEQIVLVQTGEDVR